VEPPARPAAFAPLGPASPAARKKEEVAVLLIHGMGQQLPFGTMDAVVEGIRGVDRRHRKAGGGATPSAVRLVRLQGQDMVRAELSVRSRNGREVDLHLYEAYWAPLTEGEVSMRDVLVFLLRSFRNGLKNSRREGGTIRRWMFGGFRVFPVPRGASFALAAAAAVILALVVLNLAVTGAVAMAAAGGVESVRKLFPLIADVAVIAGLLLAAGAVLWSAMLRLRWMACFYGLLTAVVLAAALVVALPLFHIAAGGSLPFVPADPPLWLIVPLALLWLALLRVSAAARGVLVQYVGDVAAYVSSPFVDRFYRLRNEIKDAVRKAAEAVYGFKRTDGSHVYDRVIVVGHSLGSVIAYDTLNALLNADRVAGGAGLRVNARTSLLLTFGSPLDKTAFIFNDQGHSTGETREAMAAAVQPLIVDYAYRTFPWINVYSPLDIVGGPLGLYDDPRDRDPGRRRVVNRRDRACRTPVLAHVEHWDGSRIYREIHGAATQAY
jgi:hypothetical protein